MTPVPEAASDADDIGRNQRSRVREMVLLETLERFWVPQKVDGGKAKVKGMQ